MFPENNATKFRLLFLRFNVRGKLERWGHISHHEPGSLENLKNDLVKMQTSTTYFLPCAEAVGKSKLRIVIASCSFEIFRFLTISIVEEKKGHFKAEMLIFQLSNSMIFFLVNLSIYTLQFLIKKNSFTMFMSKFLLLECKLIKFSQ